MTFFGLDWLNSSANVYVCGRCGFLHWFLPPGEVAPDHRLQTEDSLSAGDEEGASHCHCCGHINPAGTVVCSGCGGAYR